MSKWKIDKHNDTFKGATECTVKPHAALQYLENGIPGNPIQWSADSCLKNEFFNIWQSSFNIAIT